MRVKFRWLIDRPWRKQTGSTVGLLYQWMRLNKGQKTVRTG